MKRIISLVVAMTMILQLMVPATAATGFKVSVGKTGSGTVTGAGTYQEGAQVVVTATPKDGYIFTGWINVSGVSIDTTSSQVSFRMPGEKVSLKAKFTKIATYKVSVSKTSGGTVSGAGKYQEGDFVTVKAIPNDGYVFNGWTNVKGIEVPTLDEISFSMPATAVSMKANFIKDPTKVLYKLTVGKVGSGTVTGTGKYYPNSVVQITATPKTGYKFTGWSTEGMVIDNPNSAEATVIMPMSNAKVKATFEKVPTYKLTLQREGKGSIVVEGNKKFQEGDTLIFTATPNNGYVFYHWEVPELGLMNQKDSVLTLVLPGKNVTVKGIFVTETKYQELISEEGETPWAAQPDGEILYGDSNGDGEITTYDASLIIGAIDSNNYSIVKFANADVDLDGNLSRLDSNLINAYIEGRTTLPHVEHEFIDNVCVCGEVSAAGAGITITFSPDIKTVKPGQTLTMTVTDSKYLSGISWSLFGGMSGAAGQIPGRFPGVQKETATINIPSQDAEYTLEVTVKAATGTKTETYIINEKVKSNEPVILVEPKDGSKVGYNEKINYTITSDVGIKSYKAVWLAGSFIAAEQEAEGTPKKITGFAETSNYSAERTLVISVTDINGKNTSKTYKYLVAVDKNDNTKPTAKLVTKTGSTIFPLSNIEVNVSDANNIKEVTYNWDDDGYIETVKNLSNVAKTTALIAAPFEDGEHKLTVTVVDMSMNQTTLTGKFNVLDNKGPVITASPDGGKVPVGTKVTVKATDETAMGSIMISVTPPEGLGYGFGTVASEEHWNRQPAMGTGTVDKGRTSGVIYSKEVSDNQLVLKLEGTYKVSVTATDKKGNKTERTITYEVGNGGSAAEPDNDDITPPEINVIPATSPIKLKEKIHLNVDEDQGLDTVTYQWNNGTVKSIPDVKGLKGLAPYTLDGPSTEGTHTLKIVATDLAGNSRTLTVTYEVVDESKLEQEPPEITVSQTNPIKPRADIEVKVTDNIGLETVKCYWDDEAYPSSTFAYAKGMTEIVDTVSAPSSTGIHALKVVAEDLAGNSRTLVTEYIVDNGTTPPPTEKVAPVITTNMQHNSDVEMNTVIAFTVTDDSGLKELTYQVNNENPVKSTYTDSRKKAQVNVVLNKTGHLGVTITATDIYGNVAMKEFGYDVLSDDLNEYYEFSLKDLIDLGIVSTSESKKVTATITRAEFAKYICKMYGITEEEANVAKNYITMSDIKSNKNAGWIELAVENGIMSAYEDGTFKPTTKVTFNEAITYLIRITGRGQYVEKQGTWPGNYAQEAAKLQLTASLFDHGTDKLTWDNFVILMFRTLDIPTWDVVELITGETVFGESKTLREKFFSNTDSIAPDVEIISPRSNPIEPGTIFEVNVSDDKGLNTFTYQWGNGQTETIMAVNGKLTSLVKFPAPSVEGNYVLKLLATDLGGNDRSVTAEYNVLGKDKQDQVPPEIEIVSPTTNPIVPNTVITVKATDNIGISTLTYQWDNEKAVAIANVSNKETVTATFNAPTANGKHALKLIVKDIAGNAKTVTTEYEVLDADKIDGEAPEIVLVSPKKGPVEPSTNVTIKATDNKMLNTLTYQWDNGTAKSVPGVANKETITTTFAAPTTDGNHVLKVVATDVAGNSRIFTVDIEVLDTSKLDSESPEITVISPVLSNIKPGVAISIKATDNVGLASLTYQWNNEKTVSFSDVKGKTEVAKSFDSPTADGNYTLKIIAKDTSGNSRTLTVKYTINSDREVPEIVLNPEHGSIVEPGSKITMTVTDAGKLDEITYQWDEGTIVNVSSVTGKTKVVVTTNISKEPGVHKLAVTAKDVAGNKKILKNITYMIEEPIVYGDVNSDGTVTAIDRVILIRALEDWEGYIEQVNPVNADVNVDGMINHLDYVILSRHLAKWSDYETLPYLKFVKILGDADGDGIVTVDDANLVLYNVLSGFSMDYVAANSDVDSDGKVTKEDSIIIRAYAEGKITELPHTHTFVDGACVCGVTTDKVIYEVTAR